MSKDLYVVFSYVDETGRLGFGGRVITLDENEDVLSYDDLIKVQDSVVDGNSNIQSATVIGIYPINYNW